MLLTKQLPLAFVHLRAFAVLLDKALTSQVPGVLELLEESTVCKQFTFRTHLFLLLDFDIPHIRYSTGYQKNRIIPSTIVYNKIFPAF